MQRGEWIVRDLRARVGDRGDQRGLACVRHAEQADIGEHFQLELELLLFAGVAGCLLPRRTIDRALEAHVAEATIAALGDHHHLAGLEQLVQDFAGFGIGQDRAHGHLQHDVVGGGTEHVGAHAVFAALGFMATRETVIDQRVEVRIRERIHMPAATAVTTVGPAEFLVLFVPERDAAVPAVACGDVDEGFVDEFHFVRLIKTKRPCMLMQGPCREDLDAYAGTTFTVCLFSSPLLRNLT